ncbi:MAG TPA: hypothetical protein VFF30_04485 [Nitrososphaerales archaeon]|nr:hypothetical protein [Nitrososphaerales archaeon]
MRRKHSTQILNVLDVIAVWDNTVGGTVNDAVGRANQELQHTPFSDSMPALPRAVTTGYA